MIRNVCIFAVLILASWISITTGSAWAADASRGRLLYENHCVVCHTSKVHRREPALPLNVTDLRRIVTSWAKEENLKWSEEDVTDVVGYLSVTYYKARLKQ